MASNTESPSVVINAAMSSDESRCDHSWARFVDRPCPRRSATMTLWRSVSGAMNGSHVSPLTKKLCSTSKGSPSPSAW